jgi:PAS domain-containing protein
MKRRIFRIKVHIRRFTRRHPWLTFSVRSFMIFSAAFGGAYGFISGSRVEGSGYDPHAFAIGASFLFAIACVALATLSFRLRWMRQKLRKVAMHNEALADRNWELKEAEQRARSLFESQGDLIVLRDGDGRITFVNDAYCELAGLPRSALIGLTPTVPEQATPRSRPTARGFTTRRSRPRSGRDGSPGARAWFDRMPAIRRKCRASAATSPTAPRPNARSARPAIMPMPPTAPSRGSSRWPPMKFARR